MPEEKEAFVSGAEPVYIYAHSSFNADTVGQIERFSQVYVLEEMNNKWVKVCV